jgi:hypothetical protein
MEEIDIKESKEEKKEQSSTKYKYYLIDFILLLSLLSLTIPFIPVFDLGALRTSYFTIPVSFFCGIIAFNRIPILTDYLHHKELTLIDIIRTETINININLNTLFYLKLYRYILCVCSSVLFSLLVYYFEYEIEHSSLYWIEIFGIVFAYVASFRKIQQLISHILLFIIHKTKYRCSSTDDITLSNLSKLSVV